MFNEKNYLKCFIYMRILKAKLLTCMAVSVLAVSSYGVQAADVVGPADVGRIQPRPDKTVPNQVPQAFSVPKTEDSSTLSDEIRATRFVLTKVEVKGSSIFKPTELESLYQDLIGQEISLDQVWAIAERITQKYRNEGYFLSRAYVPAQEIENGIVEIRVVEGSINQIEFDNPIQEKSVVKKLTQKLKSKKPVKINDLEEFMLRLNDLPSLSFLGSLAPVKNAEEGTVKLVVTSSEKKPQISASVDNYGSRFLGPYQGFINFQDSFAPLHQTSLVVGASLPIDEMKYIAVDHKITVLPEWNINLSASHVRAEPGSSLDINDIKSRSTSLGIGATFQPIRQRLENLSFTAAFDGRNTNGDILDINPLTRDHIRALRLSAAYDTDDTWGGYNYLNFGVNKGLEILDSSKAGDIDLSRAEGEPDFTSTHLSYVRQQPVQDNFLLVGQVSGQYASDPLLSSEEFGFGGSSLGRAYDSSELLGDHGAAAMIEARYLGIEQWNNTNIVPYIFYDIGKVWNEDTGSDEESAASAGFGFRFAHSKGFSGNVGVAFPLTQDAEKPLYGDGDDPRFTLQASHAF